MKKLCLLGISTLVLSACSSPYSSTAENQYLQSRNGTMLVVPSSLSASNISHFYVLPAQNQDAKVSIVPENE